MLKNPILLIIICLSLNQVAAQETKPFYINVFIAADKEIYVETEKTAFEDVKTKISEIVRNMPFQVDQRVVYRIFADEELKHGYIMNVNRERLSGFDEDVVTQKYLLNTLELEIDGNNWFESVDLEQLEAQE